MIEKKKEITAVPTVLTRLLSEISQTEPDYQVLTEIIETDVGFCYKLMRYAGSVFFGTKGNVRTVKQALVRIGMIEIRKWVHLLFFIGIKSVENRELIKTCILRAKIMELTALENGVEGKHYEHFMAGLFSALDVLLDLKMDRAIRELILPIRVKDALLGKLNDIRRSLDTVLLYESGCLMDGEFDCRLPKEKWTEYYIQSLKWLEQLEL